MTVIIITATLTHSFIEPLFDMRYNPTHSLNDVVANKTSASTYHLLMSDSPPPLLLLYHHPFLFTIE